MIKQDISEDHHNKIILALGSNLGNRVKNIEKTKFYLSHFCYFLKISKLYETPSWPDKSNPKFLNSIIECKTKLTIVDLFKKIKRIEILLGRKKNIKNAPRTCDIDIIDFKGKVINKKNIILPHPEAHKRNFVLLPLFEIHPEWIHPIKNKKIHILIKNLSIKLRNEITRSKESAILIQ